MKHTDDMQGLYLSTLRDSFDAESQITKALPKVIDAATDPKLKESLSKHLQQTEQHAQKVLSIIDSLGEKPTGEHCDAMRGLLKEGSKAIDEFEAGPARDAAIICACQKIEHYEIASYGTLRVFAKHLHRTQDAELLSQILEQEYSANNKLTEIAEGKVNKQAEKLNPASARANNLL